MSKGDFADIHRMYHSAFSDYEKARRKAALKNINRDFYEDLPPQITRILDNLCWDYRECSWFEEAWDKYRMHVLEAGLGGKIKMPGFVFNEYIDKYVDEQEKKRQKEAKSMSMAEAMHSEEDIDSYLEHHGIKGQKWGIRRYQNDDGTLTEEGRKRYEVGNSGTMTEAGKQLYKQDRKGAKKEALGERKDLMKKHGYGKEVANYLIKEKYGSITAKDINKADKASDFGKKVAKGAGTAAAVAAAVVALPYVTIVSLDKFYH